MADYAVVKPITSTLLLDHCWLCGVPKLSSATEEHHLVPRCYGGERGPTVTLCSSCHSRVHEAAESLYKGNPLVPFPEQDRRERCLYLATVIVNARLFLERAGDPNKRVVFSTFFDAETHNTLVKLTKHLNISQKKVIVFALKELAKKHL